MNRGARWLSAAAALTGVAAIGLAAAAPAEAHHFGGYGRFGGYGYGYGPRFGFGYPVFYAPPPVYPVYVAPRVAYIPPPPVAYGYRYRYRRVAVHHIYHHVVHRHWCSCNCCR